jgi:hypothetical protein
MRTALLTVVTLILFTASAQAQSSWAENMFKQDPVTKQPDLRHDFGNVPHGAQLHYRFELTNIYAVPLEISVRVGCHCVTATTSTRVLESGKKGYVDVNMNARLFTGPRTVQIHFTVGPEYISTATLSVSANCREDIVLNPGQLSFGVVARGQPMPSQSIDVEYAGVLDWRATEIAKHEAPLDASVKELYRRPGQVGYRVTVALKPDVPAGALKQELFLKTNDPASPLVPILVEATVRASLSVAPDVLNLGTLKLGESLTKLVLVQGPKPFKIVAVEGQGDGVTVDLPNLAKNVQVVKVKCQPTTPGPIRKQLKIKTDLDQEAPVLVTVDFTVEP